MQRLYCIDDKYNHLLNRRSKMNLRHLHIKIFFSSIFAISMAYLESAVVVYLRELYYPDGFQFPLIGIPFKILITEIGREAATILMLFAYAKSIGRNSREVMAYLMYNFGLWDIWYYIWLKVLLDWPASMLEWDILFLIPVPWLGPVLAPVLVSLALIGAAYTILRYEAKEKPIRLTKNDWIFEIISGLIIIFSFLTELNNQRMIDAPDYYRWWIFLFGLIFGLTIFVRRVTKCVGT